VSIKMIKYKRLPQIAGRSVIQARPFLTTVFR